MRDCNLAARGPRWHHQITLASGLYGKIYAVSSVGHDVASHLNPINGVYCSMDTMNCMLIPTEGSQTRMRIRKFS